MEALLILLAPLIEIVLVPVAALATALIGGVIELLIAISALVLDATPPPRNKDAGREKKVRRGGVRGRRV